MTSALRSPCRRRSLDARSSLSGAAHEARAGLALGAACALGAGLLSSCVDPRACQAAADCDGARACLAGRCVLSERNDPVALPAGNDDVDVFAPHRAIVLRRADVDRCVGVTAPTLDAQGAEIGGEVRELPCAEAAAQVFWTFPVSPGFVALVNARSGRCLSVQEDDSAEAAHVFQRPCTLLLGQGWRATATPDGMAIESRMNGEALAVASEAPAAGEREVVVLPLDGSPERTWQVEPATHAAYVALTSAGEGRSAWCTGGPPDFSVLVEPPPAGADDEFRVWPGLADAEGISFESRGTPGRFLRHQFSLISAHEDDGTVLFANDATFMVRASLVGPSDQDVRTFASKNFPDRVVLRAADGRLRISPVEQSDAFARDASWRIVSRD